jgi:hypothetical protein
MSVSATPNMPSSNQSSRQSVKIATPDLILLSEEVVDEEIMADLLFEQVGSQEIINVARNDIVNGQSVAYRPIKNLSELATKYSPQTLVAMQNPTNTFFNNFSIKLENYLPIQGNGPGGLSVYLNDNNDLVLEFVGLKEDEQIQVQVLESGQVLDDTIYTEET